MSLSIVEEREINDATQKESFTESKSKPSKESAPGSPDSAAMSRAMLQEIRKILSSRATALIAMLGALGLTAAAMVAGTWMALALTLAFDIFALIPILIISYRIPRG